MKNEPAFPRAAFAPHDVGYEDCGIHDSQEGMTLRDYFAAKAMTTFHVDASALQSLLDVQQSCEKVAKIAYMIADAMLKQRDAEPTKGP